MTHWCPECGAGYGPETVACPRCRVVLADVPPGRGHEPVVVHRVPDAAAGALLCGVLEQHGLRAVLRSATLTAYGAVPRDWTTSAWGELVVPREEAAEARALLAEYLLALERGGRVEDGDLEDEGEDDPAR